MPWIEQLRSANWSAAGCICLATYLLGGFTSGYYLVRWRTGQDLRDLGSGSVGGRNVGRLLGWKGFLATVLVDFAKGALAVWAARCFTTDDRLVVLAVPAVVAGHVWPVQLQFRGGKGMAASLGALVVYDYQLTLAFVLLFGAGFAALRKPVMPGLFAMACLPLAAKYLGHSPTAVVGISVLAGLVVLAHRSNLAAELSPFLQSRNVHPKHDPPEA